MHSEYILKVLYLRKLKNLFTLSLFGNPICKDGDYNLYIAAYFPKLTFLDYNLLDKATVSTDSVTSYSYIYCVISLPSIISSHNFLSFPTVELTHKYLCAEK